MTSIPSHFFDGCRSLEHVEIPQFVSSIEDYAFYECFSLSNLSLPQNLVTIGKYAFSGCVELVSVPIPVGVYSIGYGAFSGCISLESIDVGNYNGVYKTIDGVLFNPEGVWGYELVQYPAGKKTDNYVVPDYVLNIAEGSFMGSPNLISVTLPPTLREIGELAFAFCTNLTSITIPASVSTIRDFAFQGCHSLASATYLGPDGVDCVTSIFPGCDSLSSVCVSFDYRDSTFCGLPAFSNPLPFDNLKKDNNYCYQVVMCNASYAYARKRENAILWDRHIGCFDLSCNNNSGEVVKTSCNKNYVCLGNRCDSLKNLAKEKTVVRIEIKELDVNAFNHTFLSSAIAYASRIDPEKFEVGIRADDIDNVTIFVFADYEKDAKSIVKGVDSCTVDYRREGPVVAGCRYLMEHCKRTAKILSESEIPDDDYLSKASHVEGVYASVLIFVITSIMNTVWN